MSTLPLRDDFVKILNTKFRAFFEEEKATEIELIEVSELRDQGSFESFYIAFRTPLEVVPIQKIYKLEHDSLEPFEVFLVPYKKDESGVYFEAGFNLTKGVSQ